MPIRLRVNAVNVSARSAATTKEADGCWTNGQYMAVVRDDTVNDHSMTRSPCGPRDRDRTPLIHGVQMARFLALAFSLALAPVTAAAQEADPLPAKADTSNRFANTFNGEFAPGAGFTLIKTSRGSLNISVYGLFRYMNQYAVGDSFTDHLGRKLPANPRNDLNWQRTFVWLTGFFYDPKFRYNISLWSLPTTQQTLLFGNLQYRASHVVRVRHRHRAEPHREVGAGIVALLGGDRPADGGGILSRRILVRLLRHR